MKHVVILKATFLHFNLDMQVLKVVHGTILIAGMVGVAGPSKLSSIMEMAEPNQTLNPQSYLLVIPPEESSQ